MGQDKDVGFRCPHRNKVRGEKFCLACYTRHRDGITGRVRSRYRKAQMESIQRTDARRAEAGLT